MTHDIDSHQGARNRGTRRRRTNKPDIRQVAEDRVKKILSGHHPYYIDPAHDQALREELPVRLERPHQG